MVLNVRGCYFTESIFNKDYYLIGTNHLVIRKFRDTDYKDLHEYLSNPEIYVFEPGQPFSLSESERLTIERDAGSDFYAVVLKENKKMIGHLYFKQFVTFRNDESGNPIWHDAYEYGFLKEDLHRL